MDGLTGCKVETNWTHPDFQHREYIQRKLTALQEYLTACEFMGLPPLRCTVSWLARKIREYRTENHYYDCV